MSALHAPAPAPAIAAILARAGALLLALALLAGPATADIPPGWERHEAAGLAFALPPGFEPHSDGEFLLSFWRGLEDMSHGSLIGAGPTDPDDLAAMTAEIRADGLDIKQSDQPLTISGHGFHQVVTAGRIDGTFIEALILFGTDPLADGRHHRFVIVSLQSDPAEHLALTREVTATLTLD